MVKDAKLWDQIRAQYAKLQEDEAGAELFPSPIATSEPSPSASTAASPVGAPVPGDVGVKKSRFYEDGLQSRHWVLACCSMMVMCEWLDRTVLSISMQSMKEDFGLTDSQVGILASASLWVVPPGNWACGPPVRSRSKSQAHRCRGLWLGRYNLCYGELQIF